MYDIEISQKDFNSIEELELYLTERFEWCEHACTYSFGLSSDSQMTFDKMFREYWFNIKLNSTFRIEFENLNDLILFQLTWG